MKIISIGDIHGRDTWKISLFGSIRNYEFWRTEVDNGAAEAFVDDYPVIHDADKIIFVGDYVDSFSIDNLTMKRNLEEIIHLKKTYPNKVILLIGNHDVQYIVQDQICSGYRPEMKLDFGQLFRENEECFQLAFFYESGDGRRTLWTHAGVTEGWFAQLKTIIQSPRFRFKEFFTNWESMRIDELLNLAWQFKLIVLFNVDSDSGGMCNWGGPVWVRPRMLLWECLEGYDQVVGHTPQREIIIKIPHDCEDMSPDVQDKIYLIDCIEHGDGNVLIKDY